MVNQNGDNMRQYYYISLPFYAHQVFKCNGFGAEKPEHLAFYKPHFEKYGDEGVSQKAVDAGPYTVIIRDHVPGLILADGTPIDIHEAVRRFGTPAGREYYKKLFPGKK